MNTGGFIQASSHLRTLTTGEFTEYFDLTSLPANLNQAESVISLSYLLDTAGHWSWAPCWSGSQAVSPASDPGREEI